MSDTKTKILDLAARYTQERGFGGFSYLDLADEIGIKAASIHYYFKSKDDLALSLVEYIHASHSNIFKDIQLNVNRPQERLKIIVEQFQQYAMNDQFCLCGMLAAELHSVSERVSNRLDAYFTEYQTWLAKQFKEMGNSNPRIHAIRFLSALEGSLLLARLRKNPKIIKEAVSSYLVN